MKTTLDIDELVFNPPDLGCVLYLSGQPGGGRKIYDRSPYANHGTMIGATWKKLPGGVWAVHLDGSDDYIKVEDVPSLDLWAPVTLELWFCWEGGSSWNTIASCREGYSSDSDGQYYLTINEADDKLHNYNSIESIGQITKNRWTHLAHVATANQERIYLNGRLDKSESMAGFEIENVFPLTFGADWSLGGGVREFFRGDMALIRLYRQARSDLQIAMDFDREKRLFGL